MSDRGRKNQNKSKQTFFAAQRLLSTEESNGWEVIPSCSWLEKQTSKAWTGKEADGGRRYPHHHSENLEEQSAFIEFVVANRFADLKKKQMKQKPQKSQPKNPQAM